ncbi:hypothetical protein GCM10023096_57230 [Nonomuraea ferruginea]
MTVLPGSLRMPPILPVRAAYGPYTGSRKRAARGYSPGMSNEEELRRLDEDIARLKQENREQREQIRDMGATDQTEIASLITQADEQAGLISELEERRESLRRRQG